MTLRTRVGETSAETALVVTPRWLGVPGKVGPARAWGFASSSTAPRSRKSWGVGDLADLGEIAAWSARLGADYIFINPVHAAEPVAPLQPSPYLPSSQRFFNPLYLRVENVLEYGELGDDIRARIQALAAEVHAQVDGKDIIDRDTSWIAKRAALQVLHRVPRSSARDREYAAFRELHGGSLRQFAVWNAIAVEHGSDYRTWPQQLQDAASGAVADYARQHEAEFVKPLQGHRLLSIERPVLG